MSIQWSKNFAALAILSLLSALVVVVTPAASRPAAAATRTWTGHVDCYGNLTNTGINLRAGDRVQVTSATGLCYFYPGRPSNRMPGEGLNSRIGASEFTHGAPVTATAPMDGTLFFYFGDSQYQDNSGNGYTVTVTVLSGERCKNFTTTSEYLKLSIGDLFRGVPMPSHIRQFADRSLLSRPLAYMQLKGSWCYQNNRVTWRSIRPVQSALTGDGLTGLVLSVQSTATGSIVEEQYNGATRYRIGPTKAVVYLEVPVAVNLTIDGVGFTLPAGARRPIYTMVMDTLLTGFGDVSCAATASAPCKVQASAEYTR
ncbi:hypothetical protein [Micromonospora endolithica]|uniref:Uncharacterized protein n=1 Tax=Micromonospora endolithica TaxID=230091 RepID=A0A3A9Z8X7_9ACTN|nr:hypothetical protein [Micromonospora endolithica]RKN44499.1 hypothetical protein D7223_19855 [Micromonospora endolithica]TWJ26006.1 hypothetical protein JD76_06184 [Micromonospora endolithica]